MTSKKDTATKPELNEASKPRDQEAQSRKDGTVTTDSGIEVEATSPVIPHGAEHAVEDTENRVFTREETLSLIGKFEPGDKVYLPTDEEGNLQGSVVEDLDSAGEWFVPAFISSKGDEILTSSGAPIMKRMNPDTREEQGEKPEKTDEEKAANEKGRRNTK